MHLHQDVGQGTWEQQDLQQVSSSSHHHHLTDPDPPDLDYITSSSLAKNTLAHRLVVSQTETSYIKQSLLSHHKSLSKNTQT